MFTSQQLENYRSKRKVLLDQERLKSFLSTWNIKIQGWKKLTSLCCCCCNAVITVVCSAVLLKLFHHDKALHNCKPAVQPASGRLFHLMKTNQLQKQTSAFKAPPLHCKACLWTLRSLFEKASSVRERKYIVACDFFFLVTLDVFTTPGGIVLVIKKVFLNLCQGVTSNISKVYASREKIFFSSSPHVSQKALGGGSCASWLLKNESPREEKHSQRNKCLASILTQKRTGFSFHLSQTAEVKNLKL